MEKITEDIINSSLSKQIFSSDLDINQIERISASKESIILETVLSLNDINKTASKLHVSVDIVKYIVAKNLDSLERALEDQEMQDLILAAYKKDIKNALSINSDILELLQYQVSTIKSKMLTPNNSMILPDKVIKQLINIISITNEIVNNKTMQIYDNKDKMFKQMNADQSIMYKTTGEIESTDMYNQNQQTVLQMFEERYNRKELKEQTLGKRKSKEVLIESISDNTKKEFPSINKACVFLNITNTTLKKYIKENKTVKTEDNEYKISYK